MSSMVMLVDGPDRGRTFNYSDPLPKTLVVPVRTPAGVRWHDYSVTPVSGRYRHSSNCKCREHLQAVASAPPVDLDGASA